MKMRRRNLLVEPPQSAASDIAFILIVFFLVCASVQPDSGRAQQIPRSEETRDKTEDQNIEVKLTRDAAFLNGNLLKPDSFATRLADKLKGKTTEAERVVVVNSREDVPYHHWIKITGLIEQAGGIITLQLEEERTVLQ